VHFHFIFPSKHVIITNYNHICNFIWLYQHCSHISDYNSHIYDYTFMTKMTHRTNLTILIKVVDLDTICIYSHNLIVGMDKIYFNV